MISIVFPNQELYKLEITFAVYFIINIDIIKC